VLDAEKFLGFGFAQAARGFCDHFLFGCGDGARLRGVAFDSGVVAVGRDEGCQRLDEMPCGAVEAGFVAGVHVLAWAAAPALAAGD
jgi:hypothetical protein